MSIHWIQLSDLHYGYNDFTVSRFRKRLPSYLSEYIEKKEILNDYIFVTGDIRYGTSKNLLKQDYDDAGKFLKKCAVEIEMENPQENMFIIPGNHDVDISDEDRTEVIKKIRGFDGSGGTYKSRKGTISNEDLVHLKPRKEFLDFYKDILGKEFTENHFYVEKEEVNILCLDSSLVAYKSEGDNNTLFLGTQRIAEIIEAVDAVDNEKPIIAIAHHGFDWFRIDEKNALEALFKEENVRLYLCGHAHIEQGGEVKTHIRPESTIPCFGAPTHMDQDENGEQTTSLGVLTGSYDAATGQGSVVFHKWDIKYSDIQIKWEICFDKNGIGAAQPEEEVALSPLFYSHSELFGRTNDKNMLIEKLSNKNIYSPIIVTGPPGMGKTELCKAVCREMKENSPHRKIPYIDMVSVQGINEFFFSVSTGLGIKLPEMPPSEYDDYLLQCIIEQKNNFAFLYFDNWEDVWHSVSEQEKEKHSLMGWFLSLQQNSIKILLSSREAPSGYGFDDYQVKPLSPEDSRALFKHILNRPLFLEENEPFEELISQLEGYPLAIVLTATQGRDVLDLAELLNDWKKIKQDGYNQRQTSLEIAMKFSWNNLNSVSAKLIWGILSFCIQGVSSEVIYGLRPLKTEEAQWKQGLHILKQANLIDYEDGKVVMLQAIKGHCFSYDKLLKDDVLEIWFRYISKLLLGADRKSKDYEIYHKRTVTLLPTIFHIISKALSLGHPTKNLEEIISGLLNYYQFLPSSIELLNSLCETYASAEKGTLLANLLRSRGDLQRRLGDVEGAKASYNDAEPLFRKEQDDLGLANLLISRGDLQLRLGDMEGTKASCDEAELLFQKEQDDLGLANLLKSRGKLQRRLGDRVGAKLSYDEAEPLYRNAQDNLGLAHLLKDLGVVRRYSGDWEGAKASYSEAEVLFRNELNDLGLAQLLMCRGSLQILCGDFESAKASYSEAEVLFRNEQDGLGLARLLKRKGNFQMHLGDLEGARTCYDEAEPLYRKERANMGLAYLLRCRAKLKMRLGDLDGAKASYDEAEHLYQKEPTNSGLAILLRERGDLQSRWGDLDGAKASYDEAELLCRKRQKGLRLANLLISRGNLQLRLGDLEGARTCYDEAELLCREKQADLTLAPLFWSRGNLQSHLGNLGAARTCYDKAESLYRKNQDDLGLAHLLKSRGDLQRRLGDVEGAKASYNDAESLYRKEQADLGLANLLMSRGMIFLDEENRDLDEAVSCFSVSEKLFEKEQEPLGLVQSLVLLCRGYKMQGEEKLLAATKERAYNALEKVQNTEEKETLLNMLKELE